MDKLLNFGLFQLGWFACVLGGAYGRPWMGAGIVIIIALWHLARLRHRIKGEAILLLAAAGIGFVWDSLLMVLGLLDYPSGVLLPDTAPVWIVAMWILFATTLNSSLGWMKSYKKLSVLLGALFGPLAYYGGSRLGGVILVEPAAALLALAAGWAVLMPLLLTLAEHLSTANPAWTGATASLPAKESRPHV